MKLQRLIISSLAVSGLLVSGSVLLWQHLFTNVPDRTDQHSGQTQQGEQPPAYNRVFTDIADCYAQKEIVDLHTRGIINGVAEKIFAPQKSITRAEFITMLDRTIGIAPLDSHVPAFQDVPKDSWPYGWIQAGVELGIANGTSIGDYSPDLSISREQAAALLVRALKIPPGQNENPTTGTFADAAAISEWAATYVTQSNQVGLMLGSEGNFRPKEAISRQETAVVLYRIIQNKKWGLQQTQSPAAKVHLGWQYAISTPEFEQRTADSSILNTMSPRWFFLESTGTFSDKTDTSLLPWARENGQKVSAMVGNRFDRESTHKLLSEPETRKSAVEQLTQFANKYQLAGLNLDFENLDPKDRDAFSSFVAELAASLHTSATTLAVAVPMDVGTDWSDPFDYAALGQRADYIVIMAYDEHWGSSPVAGSVASLKWVERGVDNILSSVSPQKVIVGMALYSRDWFTNNGTLVSEDISLAQQNSIISKYGAQYAWDPAVGQYVAAYLRDGVRHTVWLEDSRSLAAKYQMLDHKGIAGYAFWYIGSETPDVWKSMQNVIKYASVGE